MSGLSLWTKFQEIREYVPSIVMDECPEAANYVRKIVIPVPRDLEKYVQLIVVDGPALGRPESAGST